jgi:solute carrier family 35, member E1
VKELDFAWAALVSACIANTFAAVKGNENKKLMETPGLKDRLGSVGNQFALTTILGFLMCIPVALANECATMTLKKTNAVTQSVANTAKRVIVIIGVALVLGESLDPIKLLGCSIGIAGVFLYSIIDNLVKSK